MLRWTCVLLVVCMALGVLARNSHESDIGSRPGSKGTSCRCGWTNKKGRIVGGTQALSHEYPWSVIFVRTQSGVYWCSGSIITPTVIISVAHCTNILPPGTKLHIVAGSSDVTKPGQTVPVKYWIQHERFNQIQSPTFDIQNDVVLHILQRPLQFNEFVGPICMPTGKLNIENQWVKMIGWGNLGGNMPSTTRLMETDLKVQPFGTCQARFGVKYPQTQICTQAPGTTTCRGDSGGPLSYLDPETNRYTLVGLDSYSDGACRPGQATVFTQVSAFLPWIQSKIRTLGCQKINHKKF